MCWNFLKVSHFGCLWQEDWFYIEVHLNTNTIQMIWNKCSLQ